MRPVGTLGFAILGELARQPLTGYDLARRMAVPIGYMWTASHSQIYSELAALQVDRAVRARVIDGPGPRDTKRYTITARGRRMLAQWVDSPLPAAPVRSELMLRVRSFWLISPERAQAFIEGVLLDHEQRLAVLTDEERDFAENAYPIDDPSSWAFGAYATVQAGLTGQRAMIAWCRWLLGRLDDAAQPASKTSRRT